MLITARAEDAAPNDDGVLAGARSSDLRTWEVGPSVCDPGAGFGQLEVAQTRAVVGFRNTEAEGVLSFGITAPIPVGIEDGALVATAGDVPVLLEPGSP